MGRRKGSGPKEPKRKKVTTELAPRMNAGKVTEPYRIMDAIIKTDRADLKPLKLCIAWRSGWRKDADGVLKLGQFRKRSELDRELGEWFPGDRHRRHDVLRLF